MSTFANSEDPMKCSIMLHIIRVSTLLLKVKMIFRQNNTIFLKIIT